MHEIAIFVGAGGLAGAAGRWLLARLRRGTTVHKGWCELAVAALWAWWFPELRRVRSLAVPLAPVAGGA